jgi:PAS domain S-box-containing protein
VGTSTRPATSLTAESLLSLAVTVTSEQRVESALQSIVHGLAAQPGIALARIWLLPSADVSSSYRAVSEPSDYLCLVASAGTPVNSLGEDWSFLQGHFARVPFNVGKVGQVAASRHPILVEDVAAENDWIVRPEWAKREEIRSFAGHPLIFRGKLLGVVAVFSRQPLGEKEFTWLGLFANQAAVAIANACTEKALRSSERNLVDLVNTIPTAAWTTRPDGYCDFINQVWLDHAGMTAEQAQGWGWAEAIHPHDRKRLVEEWQSCLASGTPVDTEARIRRFDSSYRWFLIRGNPLKDEGGNILKWYGTCVDIEDRKRGEEALRTRELSWRQIVDNIPGLVAATGALGEVEFLNRQTLEYFGKTTEELKNWALIDAVHPDDLPRVIEARKKSIEAGQIYEIEHRCRRADGVYRWFQVRGLPVRNTENKITAWYLLLTDIDDRKKAEQALQSSERNLSSMINAIPAIIGVMRADGTPIYGNQGVTDYNGLSMEDILKEDFRTRVFHPEDMERLREERRLAFSRPVPFENELRALGKDGKYRWFLFRYKPLLDETGKIDRWYMAATDIDDRKKAEEALQSSERNLRLMINAIPTFIHVLRTDGSVLYANPAVLDYFGITLGDAQKEDYRARFFHPEDVKRLREERREALARAVPFENEQRALGKDGKYRWFLVRYNPLLDEQGRIDRWYAAATDIEDRKRAEEALQSNERNLNVMINTIPALIHTGRPDGYLDYFNQRWLEYLGCSLVDVKGWNWTAWIHPDDVKGIVDKWQACLASGEIFEYEARVRRTNGEYRWMFHRKVPLRDTAGKILKWYGSSVDIDDRKKSESKLRQVIDAIPALAWCNLPDGPNEFLNKRWHEYTGLSSEQSRGWGWQAAFHPEDLPLLMERWMKMLASGESDEIEARLRRHDGVYRWFLIRAEAFRDESGKIVRWYGTSTDIDDRKRAEAQVEQAYLRLAEAQRLSKTGSFITDLLADDHNWSEEAFRIFEFDPAAKVTVQMIRDTIHAEDLPTFDAVIARGMTGADVTFGFRIVTSRGAVKHLRGMARVLAQSGGHPMFIGALQDVTESRLAEEALNKARSELAQVARITTLNALTASIAHEVNQPLSGIITNASTCRRMLDGDPPNIEGARETARRIIRDGNRASDVVTRLRAMFSKKEFTPEPMDLNEATDEVIALSLSDLQRNRVILRSALAEDLPPIVGDRVQLQQVILNLLRNASDAMSFVEDRPRELLIKTERDEGDRVRLTVKDVGVGFTPEAAAKLFQAFYTTKKDGMGIGLSISHSIIDAHHGRLWAQPNDGPGATFSFCIPCGSESV